MKETLQSLIKSINHYENLTNTMLNEVYALAGELQEMQIKCDRLERELAEYKSVSKKKFERFDREYWDKLDYGKRL